MYFQVMSQYAKALQTLEIWLASIIGGNASLRGVIPLLLVVNRDQF